MGPDHHDTGLQYCILGSVLSDVGKLEEAEAALRISLRIMLKAMGPDHQYTGAIWTHLASVQRRLGKLEEAKASQKEGTRISRRCWREHPSVA
jgi:hypothetical protein